MLVYKSDAPDDQRGTHVLLIGIGAYDFLIDGSRENLEIAAGMEQLAAPPLSVKALADWFLGGNFQNSEQPLASVSMVVSDHEPFHYEHENSMAGGLPLPDGGIDSILLAIREWKQRACANRDNLAIFYFCGHGVFSGSQILLARDYGADEDDRFDRSLNFTSFHTAMQTMAVEHQVYLIDSCRTPPEVVDLLPTAGTVGRPAITSVPLAGRGGKPAKLSVHLAASDLSPSYGRTNGVSVYADALIRALSGGGAQIEMGMWVGTDGLQSALSTYTPRMARGEGVEQEPDRIRSARFKIHKPAKIEVPVYVTCDPDDAWRGTFTLTAQRLGGPDLHQPSSYDHDPEAYPLRREFEFVLERDRYDFSVSFGPASPFRQGSISENIHPPEVPLCLSLERKIP